MKHYFMDTSYGNIIWSSKLVIIFLGMIGAN